MCNFPQRFTALAIGHHWLFGSLPFRQHIFRGGKSTGCLFSQPLDLAIRQRMEKQKHLITRWSWYLPIRLFVDMLLCDATLLTARRFIAIPTNQSIDNDASAVAFSEFLWGAFGPVVEGYDGPRPFGDTVLDGFDFDIESILKAGQDPSALYRGYATMIDTLRGFYDLERKTKD
jgi:hypothetical protein